MRKIWNDEWEFSLSAMDGPLTDNWKPVTLPHDWLIYDTSDLYRDGYGRYRKRFEVDLDRIRSSGSHVFVVFDGVYMDSAYFLNGEQIGEWKYGYSQYVLELTDHLKDGLNELIVGVRFQSPNSRWYSGAGIYRDVTYVETPAVYIPENGVYIHVQEKEGGYLLYVDTEICGSAHPETETGITHLYDETGTEIELIPVDSEPVGRVLGKPYTEPASSQIYFVNEPNLWSVDRPYLYRMETVLGEQAIVNKVGFRNAVCDINEGFFLNGRHMKLNGVCEHHDLGLLGAEFNRSAMRRKIEILKTMGVNAIRGTHNMMATGLLELCDEMGILFISEAFDMWNHPKTDYDYARFFDEWHERDVASWVRRDRNHACVIMWSIGNEIADIHNYEAEGQAMTRHLMELVASHDYIANAYITQGSNFMPWENAQKCADILKVAGYNYAETCYEDHHREHPDWIIYGSETSSITQSRGVYHLPLSANSLGEEDEQCSALGNSTTSWSAKSYELCASLDRDMPFSQGQFLWSGFDYIGEPTPYKTRSCYFGQIDTAGFPKDSYWFWKSCWTDQDTDPFVHIFPYWDFNPGQTVDVRVVSNLPEVELFINGVSLGRQQLDHEPGSGYHLIADYRLPYEKGELSAAAYKAQGSDEVGARTVRHSFGNTDHLVSERYEFTSTDEPQTVAFYEISAVDADGYPVENACDRVSAEVLSGGVLIGMDNGDSADPDGYRVSSRRLFNGRLLVAVALDSDGHADPEAADGYSGEYGPDRALTIRDNSDGHSIVLRLTRDNEKSDVRRISLICSEDRMLTPDHRSVHILSHIEPPEASGREISYRIVDDMGVNSHLAEVQVTRVKDGVVTGPVEATCGTSSNESGESAGAYDELLVTARGDGHFRLRATTGGEGQCVRLISDLEFEVTGCGEAYRNPYEFVSGSTYSSSIGEVGNGNEKGFATARGDRTVVTFDGLDFGSYGADSITIPIFALESDDVHLKIWEGIPGTGTERLLLDTVYSHPRQWAVFIEDSWKLLHRVSGITQISFEFESKVHVRGFVFGRADKAHSTLSATDADAIYGDEFTRTDHAIEHIGNNVSIEYKNMDFGDDGISRITICGRTPNPTNPVHVRFFRGQESVKEVCEFKGTPGTDDSCSDGSEGYTKQTFELPHITGEWDVSFIFLPGSNFDLESFRFE